ncbi:MAG: Hsp20/alpha crystallin family protein [Methylococcales bacterium]
MTTTTTTQKNTVVANPEKHANPVVQKKQRSSQEIVRPVVDIHENDHYIALYAELPGVSQDNLEITIDKDNLLLEAKPSFETSADIKPVYAEFQTVQFKRSFTLSDELDTEHAEANLKHGILELKIPKKELTKPRKVEVKVA